MSYMAEIADIMTAHVMVFTFTMSLLAIKIIFVDGKDELADEDDKV